MAVLASVPEPLIIEPGDAAEYLGRMDIGVEEITAAIRAGEMAAGNMTTYHPVTAAGLTRWITVVGRLRELLAETGRWTPDNPQNRPISKHLHRGYTLSTLGGNEFTGSRDLVAGPLAARPKGRSTAAAVVGIDPLIPLADLRRAVPSSSDDFPPSGNWFLVYHRAEGVVRLEVSLPLGFDESTGQFTGWLVRVLLDDWQPDDTTVKPLDVGGQDVDFRVLEAG